MPSIKPNARVIASAINGPRMAYTIEGHSGLGLQVRGDGNASWTLRYRIDGKQREHVLHNDARNSDFAKIVTAKNDWLAKVKIERVDPKAEAEKLAGGTFGALFIRWLAANKANRKTWPQDLARWTRLIEPRIGHLVVTAIRGRDVAAMTDDIKAASTGIQANRCQSLVVTVLGWAFARGELEAMPTHRLPKAVKEKPRDRALSDEEIRLFWLNVGAGPLGVRMEQCLRLALLTGQRRSEIALAAKVELQLDGNAPQWIIPAERAKNGKAHLVPLSSEAACIFSAAASSSATPNVFPAQRGTGAIDPHGVTRAMARLGAQLGRDDWPTVHDMRRTVGTQLAMLGVPDAVISAVLNHAKEGITQRTYIVHRYADERRRALQLWADRLAEIIDGKSISTLRWQG